MPDYTSNRYYSRVTENVVVITNKQQSYIVIIFLTYNIQMIKPLHDLCSINNNI